MTIIRSIAAEALNELNNLNEEVLEEDLGHWFMKNYKNLFPELVSDDATKSRSNQRELNKRIATLAKIDPTFKYGENESDDAILAKEQGAYLPWLLKLIKTKKTTYDEIVSMAHEYKDQLSAYDDLKKRRRLPAEKKDIMNPSSGINDLGELMNTLQELAVTVDASGKVSHSDFKQDVADIRKGLCEIIGLKDEDIPQDIQKTSDVLEFIGENSKWEIWAAVNYYGTAIFDRWGAGAGWCVGGMLGNNSGVRQIEQAKNYFSNYNKGDAQYVCFQQKDKNASRPDNKYLITLGPNGSLPGYGNYQFNDSNNRTMSLNDRGELNHDSGWGISNDDQMDALLVFLKQEGLVDVFKNSKFGGCEVFTNQENLERLEKGEPFKYIGGKIKDLFKSQIKKIIYTDAEGTEHEVDAKEQPEYLKVESINDIDNMRRLSSGEPFIYDGSEKKIKELFRPLITEIIIPESYSQKTMSGVIGIPYGAFKGCTNLKKVTFGTSVAEICQSALNVNGARTPLTDIELWTPRLPNRPFTVPKDDAEWFGNHLHYLD